jgi:pyruvate kinase
MVINKAKIVATLGPASSSEEVFAEMIKAGLNVARINFSHGDHQQARDSIRMIRRVNDSLGTHVAILADLQGPKLRIGEVEEGVVLKKDDVLLFTTEPCKGNRDKVYMNYLQFPQDVNVGEQILLDDGKLVMEVLSTDRKKEVKTKVLHGGPLKSKKGVNLPNTNVSLPCLTEKDLADLDVALEEKVDWIGLSFVRQAEDVVELKRIIAEKDSQALVVAKIEKPAAVADIRRILKVTDGVMVARGDLGVEVPMQGVPLIQKMIVEQARKYSKPVIIATQMMESMIQNISPTRAEVNDVANSVLDGADALMLSGETSVGEHPVEVIRAMSKIIAHVEETGRQVYREHPPKDQNHARYITDSICFNASKIADQIGAKAILTMTHSGYSAFKIASHRPGTNILVFTQNQRILNTLSLLWGVRGFYYDKYKSTDDTFTDIKEIVRKKGIIKSGDMVIKIASMPITNRGMTNTIKIGMIE